MNLQHTGRLVLAVLAALATQLASAQDPAVLAPNASPGLLQERGAGEGPAWHPTISLLTSGDGDIVRRTSLARSRSAAKGPVPTACYSIGRGGR
jgi:hypothetical protein